VTTEEFDSHVIETIKRVSHRVTGIGADQYVQPDGTQRFESRLIADIITDAMEEVEDLIVYSCQLHIRLQTLESALKIKNN
jgi:hypothetical protein